MRQKTLLIISNLVIFSLLISACSSTIYASTGWYGLTASTDTAYLAAGGFVYAVDLGTHAQKWQYPQKANAKGFYANPVLSPDGKQLLVASYDNTLYSLDPATGAVKWQFPQSSSSEHKSMSRLIGSPLVTQDSIYQPSSDDHLYALDLNGNYKWDIKTGGPLWATPTTAANCGCIYVASMDKYVYKLDAASGSVMGKSPELGGAIVGTPAVGPDGTLYVGSFGKEMFALDGNNLTIKWRVSTNNWVWSGPVLANNVIYFGDLSGNFYALNTADGKANFPALQVSNPIVDTPLVVDNNIYFTAETDALYIVSSTGSLSSKAVGGTIYSAPVQAGSAILVTPTGFSSQLVALGPDGTQQWVFPPPKS